jgi:circadian clock protein KaiB
LRSVTSRSEMSSAGAPSQSISTVRSSATTAAAALRRTSISVASPATTGNPNGAPTKEPTLSNYLLKLYVTGKTPRAEKAIANLRRICEEDLNGRYELQIIDVLEHPQLAEDEKILATPTLIKRLPPPLRRVIGDLSRQGQGAARAGRLAG